eukprot:COSAG03_NODE_23_length_20357_cov_68.041169_6_plen_227_part_00
MKWTGEGAGVTHPNGDAAGDGCGEAEGDVACHSRSSVIHDSPEVSVEWAELALRVSSLSPSLSLSRSVCLALSLSITFPLSEGDPGASPRAALCASLTGQRSPRARLSLHWPPASALRHAPRRCSPRLRGNGGAARARDAYTPTQYTTTSSTTHGRSGAEALMPGRLQCPARKVMRRGIHSCRQIPPSQRAKVFKNNCPCPEATSDTRTCVTAVKNTVEHPYRKMM